MKKIIVISFIAVGIFILSCNKNSSPVNYLNEVPNLPISAYDYNARFIKTKTSIFSTDTIDNNIATLGRVLFYERRLSANGTVSCGSCHEQVKAFTDGQAASSGLILGKTPRNSPTICNISRQTKFFLDGREIELEEMVLKPIDNHIEMGIKDINTIVPRINNLDYYKPLFTKAFGDQNVTLPRIAKALKMFVKSIVSFESKQDNLLTPLATLLNIDERVGKVLFFNSLPCGSCHNIDNFQTGWTGSIFANIGLDEHYNDKGATNLPFQTWQTPEGFFKVPSLRNIALTAPYMHDGRFKTLEEVIEFYTQHIQPHAQLSVNLQTGIWKPGITVMDPIAEEFAKIESNNDGITFGEPLRFELSDYQKKCLVAFLHTFTDTKVITEPMYSDPFRK